MGPFFRDGHWAGSVGHNMCVSRFLGKLIDPKNASQESFSRLLPVTTTDGQVLAQRVGHRPRASECPRRSGARLTRRSAPENWRWCPNGSNHLVVAPIPTLRALAMYVVDGGWIRQTVAEELGVLQMAEGLFILLAVGSVLGLAIKDAQGRRQRQALLEERNQDLERITRIDQLTSLPNRLGLKEFSKQVIERARRQGSELMVAFLDVDRFKTINDSLGHAAGDALLMEVARRLPEAVPSADTVARLGGDECVVVGGKPQRRHRCRSPGRHGHVRGEEPRARRLDVVHRIDESRHSGAAQPGDRSAPEPGAGRLRSPLPAPVDHRLRPSGGLGGPAPLDPSVGGRRVPP